MNENKQPVVSSCEKNIAAFRSVLDDSDDLKVTRFSVNETDCALISIEAMVSSMQLSEQVFTAVSDLKNTGTRDPFEIMRYLAEEALLAPDNVAVDDIETAALMMYSGFVIIIVDGIRHAAAVGIQGYEKRPVSNPIAENDLMGSQEAFTETIRVNMSLIRRRLKDSALKFELISAGKISNTDICLVYMRDKADMKMVSRIKKILNSTDLESVLGAGFIKPLLEESGEVSLFSETGYTERPDVLAVDLIQGHIGILIDGSPFCLVYPYMFAKNFETMDDYSSKSYYAVFIKLIRYAAFILAVIFPGLYLAAVNFHPELLNLKLLLNLSMGEKTTVVTLFTEMVVIMILLEIMREASVRLPRAIGTAMSIAGGLIIGDTAVKSGIISSPLLIIIGITATASFVLPQLTQQITILRLMFIFAGGFAGFIGISVCAVMTLTNICAQSLSGVSLTSPLSPFKRSQIMNVLGKKNITRLEKDRTSIRSFK